MSACGNNFCRTSTGIHDGLTFGRGDLDEYGYWSEPCRICAEQHDKEMTAGRRDQLELEYRTQYMESGMTPAEAAEHVRRHHQWLYEKAWPYVEAENIQGLRAVD